MSKDEFIISAVLSLNKGQSGSYEQRVDIAIRQYNQLVNNGVKFDEAIIKEKKIPRLSKL